MIQSLIVGVGGTVATYFCGRRPASCTVTITQSNGTAVVTGQACVIDPVNTTITVATLTGDYSLTVASATGVATGHRYLLGDEELTIKSIAGLVVQLWAPLCRDHAAGTTFQGLGVSAAIASNAQTLAPWYDGQAVFTPDIGDPQGEVVDCTLRKIPDNLIGELDVRFVLPKLLQSVSQELDLVLAYRQARDNLLIDLGGKDRVNTFLGTDHLRRLCAHRFVLDRRLDFGAEWSPDFEKVQAEYDAQINKVLAQVPQVAADGTTTAPVLDGAMPMFDLGRL